MINPQIFTVITEFKFEAGGFIANAAASTDAVKNLSAAIDDAQQRVKAFSFGFVSNLTGASAGFLGIIGNAISGFQELQKAQVDLAVGMQATGMDFQSRMEASKNILKDMNKTSLEFGIPVSALMNTTKLLAPMLLNKGLAGPNLGNVTDLSRQFLKASPVLGIDPFEAQGQLIRTLEGQASMGDTLFVRLSSETKAMAEFIGNTKKFNALKPHERLAKLNAALGQFANQTEANKARLNSLTGQFEILKNLLTGAFSIFVPLADSINKLLMDSLKTLNRYLKEEIGPSIQNLSKSLRALTPNIEGTIANVDALAKTEKKLRLTGTVLGFTAIAIALGEFLTFIGVKVPIVSAVLARFAFMLEFLSKPIGGAAAGGGFMRVFGMLRAAVGLVTLLTVALDILFRAFAFAKIEMMKSFAMQARQFGEVMSVILNIFAYFSDGMNVIAKQLAPVFSNILPFLSQGLLNLADALSKFAVIVISGFTAVVAAMQQMIENMKNMFSGGSLNPFKGLFGEGGIMNAAADMTIERLMPDINGQGDVASSVVNIENQTVTIKNDFKEKIEPDRVAFTLKDQLLKVAQNPTQANGRTFANPGRGGR